MGRPSGRPLFLRKMRIFALLMASYLQIENISKSYGPKVLFEHIDFNINEGDKVALIAPNGTGKTSLLRILAGKDKSDSGGKILFLKDIRIAFLEQEGISYYDVHRNTQVTLEDLSAPEIAVYARLTEAQLRNRLEPEKGVFIAESPKVIRLALEAGCVPVSLLMERRHLDAGA